MIDCGNYIDDLAKDIHRAAHGTDVIEAGDWSLYRLYAVLCLALGKAVSNRVVHDAWGAWIIGRPDYDPARPPVTYDQLPPSVREKDSPFCDAIRRVVDERWAKNGGTLVPILAPEEAS